MFDWIKFEMKCLKCGEKMDGFQSKDSICAMYGLDFWEVRNFYTNCANCNSWVDFYLKSKKRPNKKLTIKDYKMEFKKSTTKEEREYRNKYKKLKKLFAEEQQKEKEKGK